MSQVQLNVLVICICYFLRFVYDLVRTLNPGLFWDFRKDQAKDRTKWSYSLFFFSLLIIIEFIPIALFTINLRYVFSNRTQIQPRERNQRTEVNSLHKIINPESPETRYRESLIEDFYS